MCIHFTAESGSSRQQNPIFRISLDWPLYYQKSNTKQQLFGTQKWHQQDTSASSDENASVHTPPQQPAEITIKPQEYKSDPEVILHHDDLYARAWEYDFEQPIFDAEKDNAAPPLSQEILVQSDYSSEEMRNAPGSPHVCSSEIFPDTGAVNDLTYTCPHMEPDVESSSEQAGNSPANPRSSRYDLR